MNIQRATPVNELLAKLIFLILPTAIVGYFLLVHVNDYYTIIHDTAFTQSLCLAAGMGVAAVFYTFRIRFLPTFILLVIAEYLIYKGIDKYATGEFDAFFISVQFKVFATLFSVGWVIGWGFIRLRYWSVILSAALLTSCILLIAKANADSIWRLLFAFCPALLYSVYIIFTAEQIYSYKDKSQKFWWFLGRRLVFFGVLASLFLVGVVWLMRGEIKETVANYGGGGKEGQNSMLKKNKDNTFDLEQYSRLSGALGRSNDLLFCAHIDNFLPGTDIPNPLYLTAFYFTKFDTLTETFERDSTIPYNDLFEPDPSKIPLFATKQDSSVIHNSLGDKLRSTVEIEVYNKSMSPKTYVAPNVGFFVQPVTIEKDFRNEFRTAFRAKSYVSTLNSAYFVYNSPDPQLRRFQEQRFAVLRKVTDYSKVDPKFIKYYTFMPGDSKFKTITDLAHKVTDTAKSPVDKMIAIRNYFLSKDENGDPLYKYTDNPGVPDIPSASKLLYFLNENHKGYCAYYAGATLFMLRAMGIPSRIAVGFATFDRSGGKNKGWYWYYADQAHAWVQVYFPGYGWIDFDTTVGNTDAQESPKPDGTPPSQPPKAWLAADGLVESVDTAKKTMVVQVRHMVFHDKDYNFKETVPVDMDMKIAAIKRDSVDVPLSAVVKGDDATVVSYAEALKKQEAGEGESGLSIIKKFPKPAPIDEVYLKRKDKLEPEKKEQPPVASKPISVRKVLWITGGVLAGILILILLMPSIIMAYYKNKYGSAKTGDKAYWAYRAANFYVHQLGVYRNGRTPMQFATTVVDPKFGTTLAAFMNIYLKKKYAKQELSAQELQYVAGFLHPFLAMVRSKTKSNHRFFGFLNPLRTVSFYVMPEEDEKEM